MKNPFKAFDDFFIKLINKQMRSDFFDALFYHITNLGGVVSLVSLTFILIFLTKGLYREIGFKILMSLIFSGIIVQILKRVFTRNRPYWILKNLNTFGIDLSDYSFPSGHSAASFSVAIIVLLNSPKIVGFAAVFLAILIAISRVYLAVHYPTDVTAGVIIGIISSLIIEYKIYPLIIIYIRSKF